MIQIFLHTRVLDTGLFIAGLFTLGSLQAASSVEGPTEGPVEGKEGLNASVWQLPAIETWLPATEPKKQTRANLLKTLEFRGTKDIDVVMLRQVAKAFIGQPVTDGLMTALQAVVNRHIERQGWVGSGTLKPFSEGGSGHWVVPVEEGSFGAMTIRGLSSLETAFLAVPLETLRGRAVNRAEVDQILRVLQADPRLTSVRGTLQPTGTLGVVDLIVQAEEAQPLFFQTRFDNQRPPSVNGEQLVFNAGSQAINARGDALQFSWAGSDGGGKNLGIVYSIPLGGPFKTLTVDYSQSDTTLVEAPFNTLAIKGNTRNFSLNYAQRTLPETGHEVSWQIGLTHKRSETRLLGIPFSFAAGVQAGRSAVTTLRIQRQDQWRWSDTGLSVANTFTIGLDALDSTINAGTPDSRFVTWRGSLNALRRLGDASQLRINAEMQISDQALLPLAKYPLGGVGTVRGYRQNRLVRDNAMRASMEVGYRLDRIDAEAVAFLDWGRGWNHDAQTLPTETLAGAGVGLRWRINQHFSSDLYWAKPLSNGRSLGNDLQDRGIHFALVVNW